MLFNFFKPKWQNHKPEVRIRAIQELSSATPEASDILQTLAFTDPDSQVRLTAIAHLYDIKPLCSLISKEPDSATLHAARNRLCHLVVDAELPVSQRTSAIPLLQDSALLTHVVLKSDALEIQQQALEQITDQDACATIVRKSPLALLRRAAAEKIYESELVETLHKETLGKDKGVNRILKLKLQQKQEAEQAHAAALKRSATLVESLEQLARGEYFPQFGAKLHALKAEWDSLTGTAADQYAEQVAQAIEIAQTRLAQIHAREEAEQLLQAQQRADKKQREQLQQDLNAYISELKSYADLDQPLSEALSIRLAQLEQSASSLASGTQKPDSTRTSLDTARELCHAYATLDGLRASINALTGAIEAEAGAATESQLETLKRDLKQLVAPVAWPNHAGTPPLLSRAHNALATIKRAQLSHKAHHQAEFTQLESCLDTLEQALSAGHSRKAERQMKLAEQYADSKKLPRPLELRLRTVQAKLAELREWQGFAVAPKKEALCTEMEALAETNLEPQQLALRIKELQKQWKLLDSTDSVHSHAIWKRFKQASDRAYEPCESYFSEQKNQRERNLEKREQLCAGLENKLSLVQCPEPNWKELDNLIKNAKREWKTLSPVDRSPGKKVQTRFNAVLAQLEAPLKAHRQQNAEQKRAIIDAVKNLLQDERSDSIDAVKQLQQQWKEIGPTFRAAEQKLWQQFRELCSDVFDHYHQSRRERSTHREQLLLPVENTCFALEDALESRAGYNELKALLDQSYQLLDEADSSLPAALLTQLSTLQQEARHKLEVLGALHNSDSESLQRRAVLCEQLEIALLEGGAEEVATELDSVWPSNNDSNSPYITRIEARYARLRTLCESPLDALKADIEVSESALRQLCIRLEIAMGEPSPVEDQALRMEYQMQRLQQALAQQDAAINLKEIQTLQNEWLCVPFACYYPELCQRFYTLLDSVR